MKFSILIMIIILWSAGAGATPPPTPLPVSGMLNIPKLLGSAPQNPKNEELCGGELSEKSSLTPIPVYSSPNNPSIIAQLTVSTELETVECGYGGYATVVYEAQDGWYRIAFGQKPSATLKDTPSQYQESLYNCTYKIPDKNCFAKQSRQMGWVRAKDAGRYFDFEKESLMFWRTTTDTWDGRLWSTPDLSAPAKQVYSKKHSDVGKETKAIKAQKVNGVIWVKVKLLDGNQCEDPNRKQPVTHVGWIPLLMTNKGLPLWTLPRGC